MKIAILILFHFVCVQSRLVRLVPPPGHEAIKEWYDKSAKDQDHVCPQCVGWNRIRVINDKGENLLRDNDFISCFSSLKHPLSATQEGDHYGVTYKWGMRWTASQPKIRNGQMFVSVKCDQLGPNYEDDLRYRWYSSLNGKSYYLMFNSTLRFTTTNDAYHIVANDTIVPGGTANTPSTQRLLSASDDDVVSMRVAPCSECPDCSFDPINEECQMETEPSECSDCLKTDCIFDTSKNTCIDKNPSILTSQCEAKTCGKAAVLSGTECHVQYSKERKCKPVTFSQTRPKNIKSIHSFDKSRLQSISMQDLKNKTCSASHYHANVYDCMQESEMYITHTKDIRMTFEDVSSVVDKVSQMYDHMCNTLNIEDCCPDAIPARCSPSSKCCISFSTPVPPSSPPPPPFPPPETPPPPPSPPAPPLSPPPPLPPPPCPPPFPPPPSSPPPPFSPPPRNPPPPSPPPPSSPPNPPLPPPPSPPPSPPFLPPPSSPPNPPLPPSPSPPPSPPLPPLPPSPPSSPDSYSYYSYNIE